MMTSKIEKLIVNFLNNQASASELDALALWIQDPHNEKIFNSYIKTNYAIDFNLKQFDMDQSKKQLLDMINNERKVIKLKKVRLIIRYAAAILVVALASTYFLRDAIFNKQIENTTPIIVNNQIEKGTDKATLTLEDGSTVILEKGATYQAKNANSNGEQIIYQPTTDNRQLSANTITIPRGGQFFVQLSDGTKVWLNSESQLKYPVAFIEGKTRQVELVYGEAYFEVSPSTEHKGSNFKVFNKAQEIEVLGTEFNIKAYKDENNIYTTLVEGKVSINPNVIPNLPALSVSRRVEGQNKILKPGEQSNVNINTKTIQVIEVDIFREVAWKEGVFSFKNKSLKEIMASLSRWYDMDVVFENKDMENVSFNGTLYKTQSIVEILSIIQGSINTYEINNKTIILK